MRLDKKKKLVQKRRWRIRKKISGTAQRPRLSVRFSEKHIYAQCIDDEEGKTLLASSTLAKDLKDQGLKPNVAGAAQMGKHFGEKAKASGMNALIFDRGGRRFHGCVKAFADAVRETGLNF